jgi:hypothetical protein
VAGVDASDERFEVTDKALSQWRQGDCVVGPNSFVHRFRPESPVTPASREVAPTELDVVETDVRGLVVVTQTCDLVRQCADRAYVEVAPLVEVTEDDYTNIERGRRPAYAAVPSLRLQRLVADLDRIMTVEKPVVAAWSRVEGCSTDDERRRFARSLARKRDRFPFPDDFNAMARPLQSRVLDKHGRNSPEGRALHALLEIRVEASPDWEAAEVEIMFWFIRNAADTTFEGLSWDSFLAQWLALVEKEGRFREVEGQVATLEEMTAQDYVTSDPLDLDFLSSAAEPRLQ